MADTITGERVKPELDHVRVSQASRRDAHSSPRPPKFESYREECDALIQEKKSIEVRIASEFSRAAYASAQSAIRSRGESQATLRAWLNKRTALDEQKAALIRRKHEVETAIAALKPKVAAECRASCHTRGGSFYRADGSLDQVQILLAIYEELVQLRKSL